MSGMLESIQAELLLRCSEGGGDWHRAVVVTQTGEVIVSNKGNEAEDQSFEWISDVMDDRTATVARGIWFDGEHYEVHRFHPPFVYGRRGDSLNLQGSGIAVMEVQRQSDGEKCFVVVSYLLPTNSAKVIPQLQQFGANHVAAL